MEKKRSEIGYNILRPFVIAYFKLKYHPKVYGKENIPTSGPIVVCGNHRHTNDQFNVMMLTKRVIHYMAKDEYFKGKNAWFFRMAGCISVDRSIHDENAKSEAKDVLNSGGALGIFPEGTRNEITCKEAKLNALYEIVKEDMSKEELVNKIKYESIRYTQVDLLIELKNKKVITNDELKKYVFTADDSLKMLLKNKKITKSEYEDSLMIPFKFGAVSLAQKTNALILPFATSGLYTGKKGKLVTRIGKPFSVQDMNLEKANTILREKILELMQDD